MAYSADSILWIGTNSKGLASYNLVTGRFTNYTEFLRNRKDGSYPRITKIFNDSNGRLWLSTESGKILKVNYSHSGKITGLDSAEEIFGYTKGKEEISVNDFCFLTKSKLLVGTEKNLLLLSLDQNYKTIKKDSITADRVIKIQLLENKIFLIAGSKYNFVYVSDKPADNITADTFKFRLFYANPDNKDAGVPDLFEYRDKIFFSLEPFHLIAYTRDLKNKVEELDLSAYFDNIRRFKIMSTFIDKKNRLWALTNGLGVLIEKNTRTIFKTLKNIPGNSSSISPTL